MNWKRTLFTALILLMAVTSATATPAFGQAGTTNAELAIEQPRHISDPVEQRTANGTRVYVARGEYLEIEPTNFNISDVTSFSVREDQATLTYDKQDTEYVLNTQGNSGTFHLRWSASENNATRTYTAQIRVVKADYAHVASDRYEQLQQDAERGDEIASSLENAGDPDEPLDQKVEFSVAVLNFQNDPFSAFTGQFTALQILRFTTPAGWLDLALIIGLVYVLTRGNYALIARLRKQLSKEEQVSRREDLLHIRQYKQFLSGKQITDVDGIDDHQAAILEKSLGTNLFTALRNFWSVWGAESLKRMYAEAMGTVGYSARVRRDESGAVTSVDVLDPDDRSPMADGGEADAPGSDPGTTPFDFGENTEFMNLSGASDDVLEAIEWEQIDSRIFEKNPDISAVDHLMVANRERPGDLIDDLDITVPEDFQSRQEFMTAIGRFFAEIQQSDFSDAENYPREDRTVLNHIMAFTSIMTDEYDIPLDLWWRAAIWNAEGLSRDDEANSVLADITDVDAMDDVGGDAFDR